jgi:hypothetical protein
MSQSVPEDGPSHRTPEGTASMSPLQARIVWWSGIVVCLISAAIYASLLYTAATDADTTAALTEQLSNPNGLRSRRHTSAFAIYAAIAILGLILGAFCIAMSDVSRRSTGEVTVSYRVSLTDKGGYAVPVRPVAVPWQIGWIVLLAAAFVVIDPVQRTVGVLAPSTDPGIALQVLIILPAVLVSALCGATATSLVKKLSYPGQLRRHPERALSPKLGGAARWWLFKPRSDLLVGAFAGVFAGYSVTHASTGSTGASIATGVVAVLFAAGAVTLALQFWRTGEPLMVLTLTEPIGNPRLA